MCKSRTRQHVDFWKATGCIEVYILHSYCKRKSDLMFYRVYSSSRLWQILKFVYNLYRMLVTAYHRTIDDQTWLILLGS